MPIGAIAGASVIGAGTSLIGASKQSKAAQRASDAQVAAADRSAAVNREIYYDQANRLEPFRQLGISAIDPMRALMGLPAQQMQAQRPANDSNLAALGRFPTAQNGRVGIRSDMSIGSMGNIGSPMPAFNYGNVSFGGDRFQSYGASGAGMVPNSATGGVADSNVQTPFAANTSPLDALRARPGYQFRLEEGLGARDASAASRGMLLSGAQQKAIERYGQDFASNEFDKEFNRLNALMGGGQVATNNINAAAGAYGNNATNALMNAGNARASGYINSGNAWANGMSGAANAIGQGVGMYGGYKGWFS